MLPDVEVLTPKIGRLDLSLPADSNHRLVGALAIDVPELLKVGSIEIGKLLTGIGERGLEFGRVTRLAYGGAYRNLPATATPGVPRGANMPTHR